MNLSPALVAGEGASGKAPLPGESDRVAPRLRFRRAARATRVSP